MFYFNTFIYSKVVLNLSLSSAKHKRYFEEGGKPNGCWSRVPCQSQCGPMFGFPHSSQYLLTDVNVCGAVQYSDTAAQNCS